MNTETSAEFEQNSAGVGGGCKAPGMLNSLWGLHLPTQDRPHRGIHTLVYGILTHPWDEIQQQKSLYAHRSEAYQLLMLAASILPDTRALETKCTPPMEMAPVMS